MLLLQKIKTKTLFFKVYKNLLTLYDASLKECTIFMGKLY